MKTILKKSYILALLVMVAMSCQKENLVQENKSIKLNLNIEKPSFSNDDTKAVKKGWEEGDAIALVFNNGGVTDGFKCSANDIVLLAYKAGNWEVTMNESVLTALTTDGTVSGVHFDGVNNNIEIVSLYGENNNKLSSYRKNDLLMMFQSTNYTLKNGVVSISATLDLISDNQITISGLTHSNDASWKLEIVGDSYTLGYFSNSELMVFPSRGFSISAAWGEKYFYTYGGVGDNEIAFYCDPDEGTYENFELRLIGTGTNSDKKFVKKGTNITIEGGKAYSVPGPGNDLTKPTNGWEIYTE